MAELALSPDQIEELGRRHLAFLEARLVSEVAATEWRTRLEEVYDAMLGVNVAALVTPALVERGIDALFAKRVLDGAVRPVGKALLGDLDPIVRADAKPLGRLVPPGARARVDLLLERPKLVPANVVRELLGHEAMEEVMRDVLFDALKAFNDGVNPFFADWGLPGLIKKVMPFGGGAIVKSMESVRAEFDKRLEPEMRKFLQGFAKKALARAGDVVVEKGDDPNFVALRKAMFAFVLAAPARELLDGLDVAALDGLVEAGLDTAAFAASHADVKKELRALLSAWQGRFGAKTLGEVATELGVTVRPDFDVLAEATWPWLRAAFATAAVRAWLASLTQEFYASLAGGAA